MAAAFFNSSAFGKSVDRTTIFVKSRFNPFIGFICDLKKPVILVCGFDGGVVIMGFLLMAVDNNGGNGAPIDNVDDDDADDNEDDDNAVVVVDGTIGVSFVRIFFIETIAVASGGIHRLVTLLLMVLLLLLAVVVLLLLIVVPATFVAIFLLFHGH